MLRVLEEGRRLVNEKAGPGNVTCAGREIQLKAAEPFSLGREWRRTRARLVGRRAWLVVASIPIACLSFGLAAEGADVVQNADNGPVPVSVAPVIRQDLYNEVTMTAEFRPFYEVQLHAKVAGYLEQINVDFGDRVKAGQLLAKLDAPDLVAQLNSALATQQRTESDYTNAHLIYTRLVGVNHDHTNLVAQQDLDTALARDNNARASLAAASADVQRYQTLVDYTRITAPFDGVITKRYADPGALIQAGTTSDTQTMPLVRLSDNYRLRLDFPVSVRYVKEIKMNEPVEVRVDSLGGKSFEGKISRATMRIEEDTRTMTTEVEVPNPNLELVPGMYATVVLRVEPRPKALSVPIEAVAGGKKPTVYLVNGQGAIEERAVTLGLETSTRYEILSGLKEGDQVMIGDRAKVQPGEKVAPQPLPVATTEP